MDWKVAYCGTLFGVLEVKGRTGWQVMLRSFHASRFGRRGGGDSAPLLLHEASLYFLHLSHSLCKCHILDSEHREQIKRCSSTIRWHRIEVKACDTNMSAFVPRAAFPVLDSLPRSYYLGHHAAGLAKMRTLLNQIDFVVECRDYRIPLTSRNPLFEEVLADRKRIIVYTKRDLGSDAGGPESAKVHNRLSLLLPYSR